MCLIFIPIHHQAVSDFHPQESIFALATTTFIDVHHVGNAVHPAAGRTQIPETNHEACTAQ